MKKQTKSKPKMTLKITKMRLHPLCEDCYNYQTPKGHGRILQSSKYYHVWEDIVITTKKKRLKKEKIEIQKMIIKKDRDGNKYEHPFSSLVPACLGLDMNMLEKNDYAFMDQPPCFVDKDRVKPR